MIREVLLFDYVSSSSDTGLRHNQNKKADKWDAKRKIGIGDGEKAEREKTNN